jgi:exodeoxyribonuclease V alpha subunit
MQPTLETITGVIERITFHNPDNGFCVLKLQIKGHHELVTVVGTSLAINQGESVHAKGSWMYDRTHGKQFKASHIEMIAPTTLTGIEKYLGSGLIKGIGPHFAKKLVSAFGENTLNIIDTQPKQLLRLNGIGKKRYQQLLQGWQEQKAMREIIIFLQNYQISTAQAIRIYKKYGENAIQKIKDNPYCLAHDIYGIGFKTADLLAQNMGIPHDSSLRAIAGLQHIMHAFSLEGHCAVPTPVLEERAQKLLNIPIDTIQTALESALEEGHLIRTQLNNQATVALASLYHTEKALAVELKRLLESKTPPWGVLDTASTLRQLTRESSLSLSHSQHSALIEALKSKLFILTGGPGVGKTTIVKNILHFLRNISQLKIILCAPTGRAAQRLHETTGWPAKTIHRLLGFDPKKFGFKHNKHQSLAVDLLIVDEASMIDVHLAYRLLSAIPTHAALFFIGDSDQLPSVGPGRVLADLIATERIPFVKLTEVFRQATTSQIITNAHRINNGYMPFMNKEKNEISDFYFIEAPNPEAIQSKIIQLVATRIPKRFHLDPIRDIQVLTPMNRGNLGTHSINHILQATLNKNTHSVLERFGTRFMVGDKVIQQTNNYDKEIFNGDIGYISAIDMEEASLHVQFEGKTVYYPFSDLDELHLAYAMSIHKSQGSEYPAVIIPVTIQHYRMLARNLLYTGVTRGKKLVILIGQKKALGIAVHTTQTNERLTQLQQQIEIMDI